MKEVTPCCIGQALTSKALILKTTPPKETESQEKDSWIE